MEVVAQRILERGLLGGNWFLIPDESGFFVSDGWGTSYASMSLRQLSMENLGDVARARTHDSVRNLIRLPGGGPLVACTFKRVLVFEPADLTERARISKIGEAHDAIAIDPEGDHLIVGSGFSTLVKTVDPTKWLLSGRKRVGPASAAAPGLRQHEVLLFEGASGRIAWYDCLNGKVVAEKRVPPFRPIALRGAVAFLGTGKPAPVGKMILPSGEEKPAPVEVVKTCTGIAKFDLVEGEVRAHNAMPPFQSLQLSGSQETLFAISKGRVIALNSESGSLVFNWTLPDTLIPMAVLAEGRRAIMVDDRSKMERILLVSRG